MLRDIVRKARREEIYDGGHLMKKIQTVYTERGLIVQNLYLPMAIGILILAGLFGGMGVMLVYLGAKGTTTLTLFGQHLETASVGVSALFIGAVTVVLVLRRLLKSVERLQQSQPTSIKPTDGSQT
jgi:hypothetical protein